MQTKNLIDASESKRPIIIDDKTGEYRAEPKLSLTETLQFVQDIYVKMLSVKGPALHKFAIQFGLQAMCAHMGWHPYEIAIAEQYTTPHV